MTLNAGIILAGQQPDIIGALRQGTEAGMMANQATTQNALSSLYAQQGADIVAGKPQAINALAGLDPMAALGVQGAQLDMQATRGRMTALANEDKRRIAELAASKSAEEAAKIAADMEQDLQVLAAVTDPAQWDQVAIARGLPELVGRFGERAPILAQSAEAFTAFQEGMKPKELNLPTGYMPDPANPGAAIRIPGVEPEGPDTVVNVGGEGDKFYDEMDKANAGMFATLSADGIQAARTTQVIGQLESVLANVETGQTAALKQFAGEYGINTEGLSDIQAAQALINQIVPQQRQPGSGPMSDADLALFKQSVPRLINQPGGNATIIQTIKGINRYIMDQAKIADAVANREITPAEGRALLKSIPNPLDRFTAPKQKGPVEVDGFKIEEID